MDLISILNFLLLALGFGFVIFWHELGHFLAAKWAGVRVDQFAVGFGNAIFSWRKGLGLRRGTSAPEYEQLKQTNPGAATAISPTEYRLNWLPLGGYVKMLGQEDLVVPEGGHEPDSYQSKSVGKRMIIISAGVVMNVILAGVLFSILYWHGFSAPAAKIGFVVPGSPADEAGLRVGDEVLTINGSPIDDFAKLRLGVALLPPDEAATFVVQPARTSDPDQRRTLQVTPSASAGAPGMLGIGVGPTPTLAIPSDLQVDSAVLEATRSDLFAVLPGETVTQVERTPVDPDDYAVLYQALQRAGNEGRQVRLMVRDADGNEREERIWPTLFDRGGLAFGGLRPLLRVDQFTPTSVLRPGGERDAAGEPVLRPGDVLLRVAIPATGDVLERPTIEALQKWLNTAGQAGRTVDLTVLRDGEEVRLPDLPLTPLGGGWVSRMLGNVTYGLGAMLTPALDTPIVASEVADGSPAAEADVTAYIGDVPGGSARVVEVAGVAVSNWYDVGREMRAVLNSAASSPATRTTTQPATRSTTRGTDTLQVPVVFEITGPAGTERREVTLRIDESEAALATNVIWLPPVLTLHPEGPTPLESLRQTNNPLQAMWWGVFETRDQIVNLYLTLKRVTVDQTVSASNLSGPVGIFHFGTIVTQKGYDWLIWFLAMLSANLAVVNFLPIPILDGGHMVFLLWERITGKAPSRRVQEGALWAGLAFLGCFVLFVTYNDLSRLITL